MLLCSSCGEIRADGVKRCPACAAKGKKGLACCWLPSEEEIQQGCDEVQEQWTKMKRANRLRGGDGRFKHQHYVIPQVHHNPRGRRVYRAGGKD